MMVIMQRPQETINNAFLYYKGNLILSLKSKVSASGVEKYVKLTKYKVSVMLHTLQILY